MPCVPGTLWYNLRAGIVPLGFKALKRSTFACCREQDVVGGAGLHCDGRGPGECRKESWIQRQETLPTDWLCNLRKGI